MGGRYLGLRSEGHRRLSRTEEKSTTRFGRRNGAERKRLGLHADGEKRGEKLRLEQRETCGEKGSGIIGDRSKLAAADRQDRENGSNITKSLRGKRNGQNAKSEVL